MDRRIILRLGLLAFVSPYAGCSHDAPPKADFSDLPPEVRADEEALQARVEKSKADREKQSKKTP